LEVLGDFIKRESVFGIHKFLDKYGESIVTISDWMLNNPSILDRGRKGIIRIIENHKKELLFGILLLIFFVTVAVAAATIYNYMYMQSGIGVEPV